MNNSIILGIGSNQCAQANIEKGIKLLRALDPKLTISKSYRSKAVGFEGNDFINAVILLTSPIELYPLQILLKKIELECGIIDNEIGCKNKNLDIDIICYRSWNGRYYDIELPRKEVFYNAHVLGPLAQIAPTYILPGQSENCQQLWQQYPHKERITDI